MAEKKRKSRDETAAAAAHSITRKKGKQSKSKTLILRDGSDKKKTKRGEKRKKTGPRLPNALRKEIERINPQPENSGEEIDSDEGKDLYEYEEELPQEETKKNRRFDPVENFEYELPEDFEDETVLSDDDVINGGENGVDSGDELGTSNHFDDEDADDGQHARMLQGITGMPSEAFEGKRKKNDVVISEAYPESEYNPSRDVLDGDGLISIQDILDPLHGKPGYSKLRKRIHQMEKKSISVQAPLPRADREKLERKVAYEQSKKDITKWEPLVKRNREAPTLYFDKDVNLGCSTVGAIASEFKPRTEFEKRMAVLVHNDMLMEAHNKDGSRLLELNKISVEEVKERQSRLAKMRILLFRHEVKAKHIKKIKSKTYHRLKKKVRLKPGSADLQMDPEAAKELAMKQEFKRAEERMTMKHKNSSKWAKRILKRGLSVQDEGTRAAISEQLHQHSLLTRKMNSMKEGSSSDESSNDDNDDESSAGSDEDGPSKLLAKAKEKTLKAMEDDDEMPNSGVFALPFMVRGLNKRKEAIQEEAKLAVEEYESSLKQLEDADGAENSEATVPSGRRVFGTAKKQAQEARKRTKSDIINNSSDSEEDDKAKDSVDVAQDGTLKDVNIDALLPCEESKTGQAPTFESFTGFFNKPQPKTAYEVPIFAPDGPKKMKTKKQVDANIKRSPKGKSPLLDQEVDEDSDTGSEGQMVDGILSSGTKSTYELPSQAELISQAFAGDDVEENFDKSKEKLLNEENPEPEKPVLLPGWGQWTHVQKKKGLPSWMRKEHEDAKRKREEALKKRKDANLKHVIISERVDKKTEKLHTKTLPFPFTSKEVFEQSIRMPIGPEFNPASAIGELNRADVVKRPGVIIKPIQFEDVNPYEKGDEHKTNREKHKNNRKQSKNGKTSSVKPKRQ